MKIDAHIANAIRNYPSLFRNRTDVLEFWFCVVGNGREWWRGELLDRFESKNIQNVEEILGTTDPYFDKHLEMKERLQLKQDFENTLLRFRYENAERLAQITWSRASGVPGLDAPGGIYPLSEYSSLARIPDNVKPEWLNAALEMIFVIFNYPKNLLGVPIEHAEKRIKENLDFASGILTSLHERFPEKMKGKFKNYEEHRESLDNCYKKIIGKFKEDT